MLIAVSGSRVTRLQPRTAPGGSVETSVALTVAHALPLRPRAQQVVRYHLLGYGTQTPGSIEDTAARWGISRGRVNDLLVEVRRFARTVPTPPAIEAAVEALTGPGVRYAREPVRDLACRGVLEHEVHPAALARAASLYGFPPPALTPGRDGPLLVPASSRGTMQQQHLHVVRRLERDIAVPVPERAVADVLLGSHLLDGLLPTSGRYRAPGAGGRPAAPGGPAWVWRSWDAGSREPGTAVRLVQRLVSVHHHSPASLRTVLVAALRQQPASVRAPSLDVAPARVLEAWLQHVGSRDAGLTRSSRGGAGRARRTRWTSWSSPPSAPLRVGPSPPRCCWTSSSRSGVSHGAAVQQLLRTPVLTRVSRGLYTERARGD